MTTTVPDSNAATGQKTVVDDEQMLVAEPPMFRRKEVKKGETFNFVRFTKDDFETTPYFQGLTGKGVKVAVLDSGMDGNHPALRNRIDRTNSRNYTYGGPNAWDDFNGHGTHVGGIIAAEENQAIMYGVAPEATLVVKKVLAPELRGRDPRYREFHPNPIAKAIRDAVDEGCQVINMSLGYVVRDAFGRSVSWRLLGQPGTNSPFTRFSDQFDELYDACTYAALNKVSVVVAAGNFGRNSFQFFRNEDNTISPPASYGSVITVASHDDSGIRSSFSSRGGELDFMAPGEVISTWPTALNPNGYLANQGTSMACPLVAGLVALLVEAGNRIKSGDRAGLSNQLVDGLQRTGFQARNPYEIREMLRGLSEFPDEHNRERGYGRLVGAYELVQGEVQQDL